MRLTSLQLQRYGNFETQTLTFDPSPGVINLVVAPNGAGKSVLRGAFCDLLFGIGGHGHGHAVGKARAARRGNAHRKLGAAIS